MKRIILIVLLLISGIGIIAYPFYRELPESEKRDASNG